MVEEGAHRLGVTPACGRAQGCAFRAASALGVRQGPGRQQAQDVFGGPVDRCRIERQGALGVAYLRAGPGSQQSVDTGAVPENVAASTRLLDSFFCRRLFTIAQASALTGKVRRNGGGLPSSSPGVDQACWSRPAKCLHHDLFPGRPIGQHVAGLCRGREPVAPVEGDGGFVAREHRELQGCPPDPRAQVSTAVSSRLPIPRPRALELTQTDLNSLISAAPGRPLAMPTACPSSSAATW